MLTPALVSFTAAPASAASVSSAAFTGENGKSSVRDGVLYAKTGSALRLGVVTDNTTRCVEVTGAHAAEKTGAAGTTIWSFDFTANAGNGVQTVTVTSYANVNPNGKCVADKGENLGTKTASYTLDNDSTGPVVTSALAPASNAAGWNKDDVTVTWSATDDSGVRSIVPATDRVTANTAVGGVEKTTVATDNVGNATTGRVTVKLDKTAPTVTGSRTPAANGHGWNNTDVAASFTTTDALSGVDTHAAGKTFGEGANQSHTGTGHRRRGQQRERHGQRRQRRQDRPEPERRADGAAERQQRLVHQRRHRRLDRQRRPVAARRHGSRQQHDQRRGRGPHGHRDGQGQGGQQHHRQQPGRQDRQDEAHDQRHAPAGWNTADTTVTLAASDGGPGSRRRTTRSAPARCRPARASPSPPTASTL
jgi:hypothetical protein